MSDAHTHADDVLTVAEADALAAPYRPQPRAGVHTWTPRTLGEYRALTLARPITDTVVLDGIDVTAPRAVCPPHPRDVRRYEKRMQQREIRAAARAETGFRVDMSYWCVVHAAALAYSWSLRGTRS